MKAEFYILNKSFAWNNVDQDNDVIRKIRAFCDLADKIHCFPEKNSLFVNYADQFGSTIICRSGITLCNLIWDRNLGKSFLNRDVYNRLLNAFQNFARGCSMCEQDMLTLLQMDEMECCHAIIVLNRIEGLPDNLQVLSTVHDWIEFRRNCLMKYPKSGDNYLSECEMCFPQLVIHRDNSTSLNSLIRTHAIGITHSLAVLNDFFLSDLKAFKGSHTEFVSHFGKSHDLDGSSFEGKGDDKFEKVFSDNIKRYCEPHLKIYNNDKGDRNCHCRIYFEFPQSINSKIYIGYICSHL